MQEHVGILLLRPLRPVSLGVGIGRDVKRVQPNNAIDVPADVFRKGGIGLVQNILPVEQRPHLADSLVTDPRHDAADVIQHCLDRGAFGVPVGARARQLEGNRADLVGPAAIAQCIRKSGIVLHVVNARPHIDEGPEHRMRGHVLDALAIDPDPTAVADRIPVLLSRADHRRSLSAPCTAVWHYRAKHKARRAGRADARRWRADRGTDRPHGCDLRCRHRRPGPIIAGVRRILKYRLWGPKELLEWRGRESGGS